MVDRFCLLIIIATLFVVFGCMPASYNAVFDSEFASNNKYERDFADGTKLHIVNYATKTNDHYGTYSILFVVTISNRQEQSSIVLDAEAVSAFLNGRQMRLVSARELVLDGDKRMRSFELKYSGELSESDYQEYLSGADSKPTVNIVLDFDTSLVVNGNVVSVAELEARDVIESALVYFREVRQARTDVRD